MADLKWENPAIGIYVSAKRKWRVERDYERVATHSYYRNWLLYDFSKGFDSLIRQNFNTLKLAKEYANTH